MVREYHVTVLPANHLSKFYMGSTINTQSHIKYTYMIGWKHSHVVLRDYASLFPNRIVVMIKRNLLPYKFFFACISYLSSNGIMYVLLLNIVNFAYGRPTLPFFSEVVRPWFTHNFTCTN